MHKQNRRQLNGGGNFFQQIAGIYIYIMCFCFRQNLGLYFCIFRKLMCHKTVWYRILYYMVFCCTLMLSICTVEFMLYDFVLGMAGMVYYGIIFINRKSARKHHNSWGFAVTSFWGTAKWPNGLARRRNAQRSQEAVCFDVYPWMRRAMVGAISCCFRVEGGHVHLGNCCPMFLRWKFQQRYPKTVHVFWYIMNPHSSIPRSCESASVYKPNEQNCWIAWGLLWKGKMDILFVYTAYQHIYIAYNW